MTKIAELDRTKILGLFRKYGGRFSCGWEATVRIWIWGAGTVLVFNLILTIWASTNFKVINGLGTLYRGDCQTVSRLDTGLHVLINIFSSLILGASNYTMQVLCSPTRRDIDTAHRKGTWLDIGVPSVRNLWRVQKGRALLWWLLGLSSIPMHFLFNSASFQVIGANDYNVISVDEHFVAGAAVNLNLPSNPVDEFQIPFPSTDLIEHLHRNISSLQNLTNKACMQAYSNPLVSMRSNVLVVISNVNVSNNVHAWSLVSADSSDPNPLAWMCTPYEAYSRNRCSADKVLRTANYWHVFGEPVLYCLSQLKEQECRLQFSQTIMVIVILCNVIKLACLACTIIRCKERALCTLGDALDSFLTKPDPTTEKYPLLSKDDLRHGAWHPSSEVAITCPKVYVPERRRWLQAPSIARWLYCVILISLALSAAGFLYYYGLTGLRDTGLTSIPALWKLGFGKIDPATTITLPTSADQSSPTWLIGMVLLANLPQVILSFLYLMYNGIWTCMLAEREWASFASHRKGLRVSRPKGEQRSTFYLELPLRYGLPLVAASSLLHWLVSQSLFFVRILIFPSEAGDNNPQEPSTSITSCGYSPIAIFFVILTGCTMLIGMLILGLKKYPVGMPLAGSCSAVISAACHPPVRPKAVLSSSSSSSSSSWEKKLSKGSRNRDARVEERVMWGWVYGDEYPDGNDSNDDDDDDDGDDDASSSLKNEKKGKNLGGWNEKQKTKKEKSKINATPPLAVNAKRGRFTFSTGFVEKPDPFDPTQRKIVTSRVHSFKIGKEWTKIKDLSLDLGDSPV